ncbi:hypothetical protein HHI36_006814 [Cryptolaemus montrouzieri]|uniref:Uncharacterized protein n=1 Tax=Cryptolaemus montrouzieri TaxID=559131 RepID=A0ABD2NZ95_9CUCU
MASNTDLSVEIAKLKKEFLIEIILTRKVPMGVIMNKDLRDFVGKNDSDMFHESNSDFAIDDDANLKKVTEVLTLESELRMAKIELTCPRKVISGLEKTIFDKEMIIVAAENESQPLLNEQASEVPLVELFSDANMRSVRKTSSTAVVGSGGSSTMLACAAGRAWLHVGGAGKNVKGETFLRNLERKFLGKKRHDNSDSVSFKVGADITLLEDLNKPESWPNGVNIRRFQFFRKNTTTKSGNERKRYRNKHH